MAHRPDATRGRVVPLPVAPPAPDTGRQTVEPMPAHDLRALGRAVRAVRKRLGLRQRDLAAMLGCSQHWVSLLETGQIRAVANIRRWDLIEELRRWVLEQEEDGGHG